MCIWLSVLDFLPVSDSIAVRMVIPKYRTQATLVKKNEIHTCKKR
jgi:hypothetical protein